MESGVKGDGIGKRPGPPGSAMGLAARCRFMRITAALSDSFFAASKARFTSRLAARAQLAACCARMKSIA